MMFDSEYAHILLLTALFTLYLFWEHLFPNQNGNNNGADFPADEENEDQAHRKKLAAVFVVVLLCFFFEKHNIGEIICIVCGSSLFHWILPIIHFVHKNATVSQYRLVYLIFCVSLAFVPKLAKCFWNVDIKASLCVQMRNVPIYSGYFCSRNSLHHRIIKREDFLESVSQQRFENLVPWQLEVLSMNSSNFAFSWKSLLTNYSNSELVLSMKDDGASREPAERYFKASPIRIYCLKENWCRHLMGDTESVENLLARFFMRIGHANKECNGFDSCTYRDKMMTITLQKSEGIGSRSPSSSAFLLDLPSSYTCTSDKGNSYFAVILGENTFFKPRECSARIFNSNILSVDKNSSNYVLEGKIGFEKWQSISIMEVIFDQEGLIRFKANSSRFFQDFRIRYLQTGGFCISGLDFSGEIKRF